MTTTAFAALAIVQAGAFAIWLLRKPRRTRRLVELARYSTSDYARRRKMRLEQHRVWMMLRTR